MSKIKLTGESSGYVEISAGSNAGNNTLELPTSGTRLVASDSDGNVTIGGTLTYADVTNVDSVGVITARSGLHVTGGSVGIGTDNPDRALSVSDQTNGNLARFIGPTNNLFIMNDRSGIIDLNSSGTGDHLCLGTQNIERLRINSAGNVGIGSDNPGTRLNVAGEEPIIRLSDTDTALSNGELSSAIEFAQNDVSDPNGVNASIRAIGAGSTGNLALTFHTGQDTERVRIGASGQIGLGGANYGTARQVLKSNGSSAAPTWSDLYSFYFYGEQDAQQGSWPNATYKKLQNLGNYAVNVGSSSIATWDESTGNLTIGADGAGYWFLSMSGGIDDIQDADFVQVVIGKNGGNTSVGTRVSTYSRAYSSSANQITDAQVSCITNLSVGDVVRFYLYHQEGTADEHSEPSRCHVMGYKI